MQPVPVAVAVVLLAALAAVPMGCASSGEGAPPPSAAPLTPGSLEGTWTLARVFGEPFDAASNPGLRGTPTLAVDAEGRVSGLGGVNRYTSSLDASALARGEFSVGAIASTKMAGPPAAMRAEDDFFRHLSRTLRVDRSALAEGSLVLRDGGGAEALRFARSE